MKFSYVFIDSYKILDYISSHYYYNKHIQYIIDREEIEEVTLFDLKYNISGDMIRDRIYSLYKEFEVYL